MLDAKAEAAKGWEFAEYQEVSRKVEAKENAIQMVFKDVVYTVDGPTGPTTLLNKVFGFAVPGRMVALMVGGARVCWPL